MFRITELLREKNHYLLKFLELNKNEILKVTNGNFDSLDIFYDEREDILNIIQYLDKSIEQSSYSIDSTKITNSQKDHIKQLMNKKDKIVKEILEKDLLLISKIEEQKSNIIRSLRELKHGKKAIKGYSSKQTFSRFIEKG